MKFETDNYVCVRVDDEHVINDAFNCVVYDVFENKMFIRNWPLEQVDQVDRIFALTAHIVEDDFFLDVTRVESMSAEDFEKAVSEAPEDSVKDFSYLVC